LKDKEERYSKTNITPCIHLFVYHVPKLLGGDGSVKIFTGQGVEKTNDVVTTTNATSTMLVKTPFWHSND
jgi:hypothetical protein